MFSAKPEVPTHGGGAPRAGAAQPAHRRWMRLDQRVVLARVLLVRAQGVAIERNRSVARVLLVRAQVSRLNAIAPSRSVMRRSVSRPRLRLPAPRARDTARS